MFLKSLELNGFKSFAQKTILEFPRGITAIVGPNGAGKSNVIDAIRWLLGERETKNLRSAKAEDLIFNGTPQRPRMSMAQAGLYFDNSSGFFPVDFKEVSIVRRVGRDGVSQYFLNKAEARLKDVIDFFSRSRLGTRGLIIINQGDGDLFVRASPQQRKVMIEEILGLREYQIKKSEAERKLKNTALNLEKVKAVINEVVPRLRTLKRQTNKWLKRVDLQKELEDLENIYFFYKLNEIKTDQSKIDSVLRSLDVPMKDKEKELKILESEIKKIEVQPRENYQAIKKIKEQQNKLLLERSQIQKELGRLETKLEFLANFQRDNRQIFQSEDLLNLIDEIRESLENSLTESNLEGFRRKIKLLLKRINDFLTSTNNDIQRSYEISELNNSKNNLEARLDFLEKELKKIEEREAEFAVDLEKFNKKLGEVIELTETKRRELRNLEEEKNKLLFEKEKVNFKFQDLENQLRQIGKKISDLRPITNDLTIFKAELPKIEERMFKLRTELAVIGEVDESLVRETQEVENHYNFLINQSQDLEKAMIDLKNLIKELDKKIHFEFNNSLRLINEEFNKFFRLMFGGGSARLKIESPTLKINNNNQSIIRGNNEEYLEESEKEGGEIPGGVEIVLSLPKKRITSLEALSGGEKSLVSIAALFALISVSPPPFLVLDEIDAALDENNSKRFANFIKEFSKKTQFIIVTHNRAVMEVADVLYGITMGEEGTSRVLSLKLEVGTGT